LVQLVLAHVRSVGLEIADVGPPQVRADAHPLPDAPVEQGFAPGGLEHRKALAAVAGAVRRPSPAAGPVDVARGAVQPRANREVRLRRGRRCERRPDRRESERDRSQVPHALVPQLSSAPARIHSRIASISLCSRYGPPNGMRSPAIAGSPATFITRYELSGSPGWTRRRPGTSWLSTPTMLVYALPADRSCPKGAPTPAWQPPAIAQRGVKIVAWIVESVMVSCGGGPSPADSEETNIPSPPQPAASAD